MLVAGRMSVAGGMLVAGRMLVAGGMSLAGGMSVAGGMSLALAGEMSVAVSIYRSIVTLIIVWKSSLTLTGRLSRIRDTCMRVLWTIVTNS